MTWAECMAERGVLFQYGGLSGQPTPYPALAGGVQGAVGALIWISSEIWDKPELVRPYSGPDPARPPGRAAEAGDLPRPSPLDEIVEAHRFLEFARPSSSARFWSRR